MVKHKQPPICRASDLFTPGDIEQCFEEWRATCGPAALAAILMVPVQHTRPLLPAYRGWVTQSMMRGALSMSGAAFRQLASAEWPAYGLSWIQLFGPWCDPGRPKVARYKHTHWVASWIRGADCAIFDVNAGEWLPLFEWGKIIDQIVASHRGATGWSIERAWEVAVSRGRSVVARAPAT